MGLVLNSSQGHKKTSIIILASEAMLFLNNKYFVMEKNLTLLWKLYLQVIINITLSFRGGENGAAHNIC